MTIKDTFATNSAPVFAGKGAFDSRKFRLNGGDSAHPCYYDVVWDRDEYRQPCKVQRAFVSADWFPDWASWKRQADATLAAVIGGKADYFGSTVRSSKGYPISGTPHFLLDDADVFGKRESRVWINILCPSEEEFTRTVAEARALIAERERIIAKDGHAGLTAALSAESPHYNPLNNATAGKVSELFD